ncbi:BamA/TamA family outer membrane protein, partial [Planctomycetota bacterium]|nr:BamA/TamA family outer membrane protein [Planctomycetota bacterium]
LDDGWWTNIRLDPELRVDQGYRGDDGRPRFAKILLNRARFRVDLNNGNKNEAEFGLTIHPLYDYSHAIFLDAFAQEDERGFGLAYSYGFGGSLDERRYSAGVRAGFTAEHLIDNVIRQAALLGESEGNLVSVNAGLSFDTRAFQANPTFGLGVGVGIEHSDTVFGTDFRFDLYSASLAAVYSVVRGTQLGVQLIGGYLHGSRIPAQRRLDAGGEGAVRGIRTSEFLGRYLFVVRSEVRQMLLEDLDVPVLWMFWLRKLQGVLFLDAGDAQNDFEELFDGHWRWGTGFGVRAFADVFGVTNITFRFDVGFRIDETDDLGPEFYFGAGQSF